MNKNDYLSNAAKYFLIGTVILIVSKIFNMLTAAPGGALASFAKYAGSITNFAFYGFLVLAYLALNGEGIAHKRQRSLKRKKITGKLKWLVGYNIIFIFLKSSLDRRVLSPEAHSGAAARLIMGFLSACASLSFFLFVISLWYLVRDRKIKGLLPFQGAAVIISAVYFILKFTASVLVDYRLGAADSALNAVLSSAALSNTLCLLQYAADSVMFAVVKKRYAEFAAEEDEIARIRAARIIKTVSIYDDKGFGIDESDDFLLPKTEPEICAGDE